MVSLTAISNKLPNALKSFVANNTFSKNQLMQQAIQLTSEMGKNYPELYVFLDETPLFLTGKSNKQIHVADFEIYLETLKAQLHNYINMHPHMAASAVAGSMQD